LGKRKAIENYYESMTVLDRNQEGKNVIKILK
jgi:hypothetical protein